MDTIHPLTIGDTVPDLQLGERRLSDYKGQLVIVDFWATWCSPCIAMLPKMDSLQRAFAGKLQVVAVTYQPDSVATPFLEHHARQRNTQYAFARVTDDIRLRTVFPHHAIPHYVWLQVDEKGNAVVKAITDYEGIHPDHIAGLLAGKDVKIPLKKDGLLFPYNPELPLFALGSNVGLTDSPLFYSVFTPFKEGLGGGMFHNVTIPGDTIPIRRVTMRNMSMIRMYQIAYGGFNLIGWNRTVINVADTAAIWSSARGQAYMQWLREGHGFCFEMTLPAHMAPQAFPLMRQQLDAYFPAYRVYVDSAERNCLVLHRTSDATPFATSGGTYSQQIGYTGCKMTNQPSGLQVLAKYLGELYLQLLPTPVIDETGYTASVDLTIDAPLTDVEAINRELAKYDLALTVMPRKVTVLVVEDKEVGS